MKQITLIILLITSLQVLGQKKLDNVFYCQNTMWHFDNKPDSPKQKAALLHKIGYDGLEGFGYKDFFELKEALSEKELVMPVNYVELNYKENGQLTGNSMEEIKEMIRFMDKGAIIYFAVKNEYFMKNKELGDEKIVPNLRQLAEYAQPYGVKLCSYPHINFYVETLEHAVKLAQKVDRTNFGASLNLCHLLKAEGSEGIDQKIKVYTPYLFAINICGADDGETREYSWERLIQPLGKGSFDTFHFICLLKDNGYNGPIGVQCYGLKGDAFTVLTEMREVWETYKKRYAN